MQSLKFILPLLTCVGLFSCQKNEASQLHGSRIDGGQSEANLALGSGYTRDFGIFLNQKENCLTGEEVFVPNPELTIKSREDLTLDESLKQLFVNTQISVNWNFLVAKAKINGDIETSLDLLSKDRRVVLFTEINYRAGSLFLKNLQWNDRYPLGSTPKEILALGCGDQALTRVDLGTSVIVAFDFVANSDALSQKLKAKLAGEVKLLGKKKTKNVTIFDGHLLNVDRFEGSAKIYARQVGGSMGEFEVLTGLSNGEKEECKLNLSAQSTDDEINSALSNCLSRYERMISYISEGFRRQIKNPAAVYMKNPPESLSSFAPLTYYFEEYSDLGFNYPLVQDAFPRDVRATIKLILKRYMALRALIKQLERFKSSGIDFSQVLATNRVSSFDSVIEEARGTMTKIFKIEEGKHVGEVLEKCRPNSLNECKELLKSLDKKLDELNRKYPIIRNNIHL
jgi:hypothetical protein